MKRGDISIERSLYYIIGAFFLIVVIAGIIGFGGFDNFKNLFPNFGDEGKNLEGVEKLRYDISDWSVKYYDGTNWILINNEVDISGKKFSQVPLQADFGNFYYSNFEEDRIVVNSNIKNLKFLKGPIDAFYYGDKDSLEPIYFSSDLSDDQREAGRFILLNKIILFSIGDSKFLLNEDLNLYAQTSRDKGYILVRDDYIFNDDSIFEFVLEENFKKRLIDEVISWRDSVFKEPVKLSYRMDKGFSHELFVCAKKFDDKYIIVDLSQAKDKYGEICDE